MLREFDTGSKHLPFGNCSINSHDLLFLSCIARRQLMLITLVTRASDKSQKKKSNFAGLFVINSRTNQPISREFCRNFWGKLRQKAISRQQPILWLFSGQISLEIDWICADETSVFNVFLTEVIINLFFQQQYAASRNEPIAKPLQSNQVKRSRR